MTNGNNLHAYWAIAPYYENLIRRDYCGWGEFLLSLLGEYSHGKIGVDAACGSGYFTRVLKKNGFNVVGTDISPEMLTQAQQLSAAEGLSIEYRLQDLSKFKTTEKVDFVTVINDGFNYLDGEKLKKSFTAIYSSLAKGGVLIFDVSSEYKLLNVIGNNVFCEDDDNVSYMWFNTLENDRVIMELSIFERVGEFYRKNEESHVQYVHTADFILKTLETVGFEVVRVCAELGRELNEKSERIIFVAKKNGKNL